MLNRGSDKGDPLSPFHFTLVANNLSCLIKRAEERGLVIVKGFKVGNNNVSIAHLQFADDTIIFSRYINNIRLLLKSFERIKG